MFGRKSKTHRRNQSSGQFYFVDRTPGVSEAVRDEGDNVDVIELKGEGNFEEEFRPKPVNRNVVSQTECQTTRKPERKNTLG